MVKATKVDGSQKASARKLINLVGEPLVFEVDLAAPSQNQITLGNSLSLTATASTNIGEVSTVDFQVNGRSVHQTSTAPYRFNWQPTSAGVYNLDVLATKKDSSVKKSETITITVNAPPQPNPPSSSTDKPANAGGGGSISYLILLSLGVASFCRCMSLNNRLTKKLMQMIDQKIAGFKRCLLKE
ncbi:Ig-like domain-containing protein [Paraglaciecola aquimarina]|uniref:Ig-like domain-containing protein n=1 Tax=Paraglaciecola aquimarina TaxID=1235557 RepID=A0ABU3SRD4_9ALTE|nr:Ig-like domain-containing protein [Paraglaciecola aquimarina]MDU0352562.1 Ig-like domain-containing protein [Paraglaciecola aquimarina]